MKILYVVQRYGERVAGGAEALARLFAEQLARRGHDVSVLTSCATDYRTWEDDYPEGTTTESAVNVTRCPVPRPRVAARFDGISARALASKRWPSAVVDRSWMFEQGPILDGYAGRLRRAAADRDVVAFMTYLYPPTVLGLPEVSPFRPTVLHPTAHDEAPMRLPIVRRNFDEAHGLAFSTPEEAELVQRRFRPRGAQQVVGIGFDAPPPAEPARFRSAYGLEDDPYLLFLGRIDPNKAADEAIGHVLRYRAERGGRLRLVMMGMPAMEIPEDPGLVVTGFVDDQTRWDAIAGSLALIQPSYQESFSMAVPETWLTGRPAIVQGHCDVLRGLAERSGGAMAYFGYEQFRAATDLLQEQPRLAAALGEAGLRYTTDELGWPAVISRYEGLLSAAIDEFGSR